jgi:hypothetical protein
VIEKRAFHRVPFANRAILTGNDNTYLGRLNNISFGGALIRLDHDSLPPQVAEYLLTVHIDPDAPPLEMIAEVAFISLPTVGLKFTSFEHNSRERLELLMQDIERRKYTQYEQKSCSEAVNAATA